MIPKGTVLRLYKAPLDEAYVLLHDGGSFVALLSAEQVRAHLERAEASEIMSEGSEAGCPQQRPKLP